jgi:hypothetical protein
VANPRGAGHFRDHAGDFLISKPDNVRTGRLLVREWERK